MGFLLKEDILSTANGVRVIRCRDGKMDFFTIFSETGKCVTIPPETMVEVCAKMGNYFGLTKMECPPPLASIQKALEKTAFLPNPPFVKEEGTVKMVETKGVEDAVE